MAFGPRSTFDGTPQPNTGMRDMYDAQKRAAQQRQAMDSMRLQNQQRQREQQQRDMENTRRQNDQRQRAYQAQMQQQRQSVALRTSGLPQKQGAGPSIQGGGTPVNDFGAMANERTRPFRNQEHGTSFASKFARLLLFLLVLAGVFFVYSATTGHNGGPGRVGGSSRR